MPKPSLHHLRQFRQVPQTLKSTFKFPSSSPATYALGLSYAGKDSPPFVHPRSGYPRTGFAHLPAASRSGSGSGNAEKIKEWVKRLGAIPAGRGELESAVVGGWTDEARERTRKWGAGEDFYSIEAPGLEQSDTYLPGEPQSRDTTHTHLAISDGVGGWSDTVDPSFFSQGLMYHYSASVRGGKGSQPLDHLRNAYEGVLGEEVVVAGGATACGVSMDLEGVLHGVNLGDSGCTIIRDGRIGFATVPGTHYFNCPKQLSKIPKSMMKQGIITDTPDSASDTFTAQLQPGDVIMLYTDGLSDNVPASHFLSLLRYLQDILASPENAHLDANDRARELARLYADVLVGYGRAAMARTGDEVDEIEGKVRASWKTPFETEALKEGMRYKGGKVDDITVVTAVVGEKNPES